MTASPNPIERSFEIAAERCEDLTPLVYRRLFDAHPEARTMFRTEGSELVKGSMLALTIDAILDFAGERTGHFRMIECEVSSHDAYGTPRELFVAFFGVIAETLREILGARLVARDRCGVAASLLGEIESLVAAQNQTRLRPLRKRYPATKVIKIIRRIDKRSAAAGGANAPIVRDSIDPRRVQSTPSVKTTTDEGASDVWDREILNDKA